MCEWGDTVSVKVRIPADLSATGKTRVASKQIDRCIAQIVSSLQRGGIDMRGSCCGHGGGIGDIQLEDGRVLVVLSGEMGKGWMVGCRVDREMIIEKARAEK